MEGKPSEWNVISDAKITTLTMDVAIDAADSLNARIVETLINERDEIEASCQKGHITEPERDRHLKTFYTKVKEMISPSIPADSPKWTTLAKDTFYVLGIFAKNEGHLEIAEQYLTKAIALGDQASYKSLGHVLAQKGVTLIRSGNMDEATNAWERAKALGNEYSEYPLLQCFNPEQLEALKLKPLSDISDKEVLILLYYYRDHQSQRKEYELFQEALIRKHPIMENLLAKQRYQNILPQYS